MFVEVLSPWIENRVFYIKSIKNRQFSNIKDKSTWKIGSSALQERLHKHLSVTVLEGPV
jgi:hypothetical protein